MTDASSASFEERETPPIISPEEKHQLILAHTAARAPRDPLQRATLWGGVAIAFGAILVGWFFTVGRAVKMQISTPAGDIDALTQRLNEFTKTVETNPVLQGRTGVPNPTPQAAASQFADQLQGFLGATSTPEGREDLIAPAPSATGTPAQGASTAPAMINPNQMPGLERTP
jgi:hypothetical protein